MARAVVVLWVAAVLFHSAHAEEAAALYRAYWAGLPAAEIHLTLNDDSTTYRGEIAIRTEGLAHLVTRFRGSAVSEDGSRRWSCRRRSAMTPSTICASGTTGA